MASEMDATTYTTLPEWRRDDTRNIRSNAKAERVLGVASYNSPSPNGKIKKKASPLNFSLFSDLKDVLPTLHRKTSKSVVQTKASDTESMDSTPSPTFDPAASTTSLNTLNSSPVTPKRYLDATNQNAVETLSQAETVRVKKFNMPAIAENNQLAYLAPSSEYDQDIIPELYKDSESSVVLFQLDDTSVSHSSVPTLTKISDAVPPLTVTKPITATTTAEKHVQDWLASAQLDRRPSLLTRSSSLPIPELNVSTLSSSSDSIQTLTSEAKEDSGASTPQWPLPIAGLPSPRKMRKINRSNLRMESVLSLSSDEDDSDDGTVRRRSNRSSKRRSNPPPVTRSSRYTHQRDESNASSVIQLDSRPITRSAPTCTYRIFPKRTLADIAASAASRPLSCDSWETDLAVDATAEIIPEEEAVIDFLVSPASDAPVLAHPLWRSSTGSSDIDVRISRPSLPLQTLHTLIEEESQEQLISPADELLAEVNVSDFPIPPRSRSGSMVPSIHVQHIDDTRKASSSANPTQDTILLSPSMVSRSNSTKSENSIVPRTHRLPLLPQEANNKQDRTIDAIMRKRTISNVPIYVTGLESAVMDGACDDGDIAFFVHSSIF